MSDNDKKAPAAVSERAQGLHRAFDSMLDALVDDEAHLLDAAASERDHAHKTLKVMKTALRLGEPSQRMLSLLAEHLARMNPEQALSVLGLTGRGRPSANFRRQLATDTFESMTGRRARRFASDPPHDTSDPDGDHAALIATYDDYFKSEGRTYARDLAIENDWKGKTSTKADQTMETVIKHLLRGAGLWGDGLWDKEPRGST